MKTSLHNYLIIGAGPAGLQLGYFLQKGGRDYLILEGSDKPGHFFEKYPRHGELISINKRYTGFEDRELNLRWDWNSLLSDSDEMLFKNYSKDYFPKKEEMVRYMRDFATHFDLNVEYNAKVTDIAKRGDRFVVTDSQGQQYECLRLIVATGVSQPYTPQIPGIEFAESYADVSIDPQDFENQRVLLIGKGNSAFETANHLLGTTSLLHLASPDSITMAWRSHFVGHIRSVNMTFLDSYLLKSQNVLIDAEIVKIEKNGESLDVTYHYSHADDEVEVIQFDRIITCAGFRFDASCFDASCQPDMVLKDRFPAMTSEWESTNVANLYFAGTITQSRDYKKKQSGFIHGFRYNVAFLYELLEQKYHGTPLPFREVPLDPEALMRAVIDRSNTSSSLWQQTGYFCDTIVISGDEAHYYKDHTLDYTHELFRDCDHYYTLTFEFGQERIDSCPDPFAVDRIHKENSDLADLSTGIHPIIRRFSRGDLVNTHHVIEDLDSIWAEAVHTEPLAAYFASEFAGRSPGNSTPSQPEGVPV